MLQTKYWLIVLLVLIVGTLGVFFFSESQSGQMQEKKLSVNRASCLADDCLAVDVEYPAGELPSEVKNALARALDDEYKAYATYEAVIAKFGSVRPFAMIIGAEEQHIAQLKAIYTKYGITPEANSYLGKLESPATLASACELGVKAEIDNAALYRDQLLPAVTEYVDITSVFTNLMNASQDKHLPAFQRCGGR